MLLPLTALHNLLENNQTVSVTETLRNFVC